ncbi:MAG TPA: hypothetical protein VFZ61_00435 [Polyangiales bacterium]
MDWRRESKRLRAFGWGLGILAQAACATRELPARHAESSPLSEDAQASGPLAVNATLEGEPAMAAGPTDGGTPPDGQAEAPSDHAHHHHHQHGGDKHAH